MSEEINPYRAEYDANEADANRQMVIANAFSGGILTIVWILYLTHVFPLHGSAYLIVAIVMPIEIAILFSPLLYLKSPRLAKKGFKYFLIFSLLMVVAGLNIIVPKHGVLAWPVLLALACHYYNPRLCKVVFAATLISMFFCLYAGMFFGEYDSNLLTTGVVNGQIVYPQIDGVYYLPDGPQERFAFLHRLIELGENRYVNVFVYYFVSRTAALTMIFFVSNALNHRTYRLLLKELKISNEQGKVAAELEVAKGIQYATLPGVIQASKDLEIVGELKAAKEVGGDFYDYFDIDEHHTACLIGDVSGKGVPAAMFMMKAITCLRNFTKPGKSPSQILLEANEALLLGNDGAMFATCFFAILDKRDGTVIFANAGHNAPIIGKEKDFRYLPCKSGFLLGSFATPPLCDETVKLRPGESLTLYTDGITEARDSKGEFFGNERLLHAFNKQEYTCLVELHHTIKDDINAFVGEAPQSDDIAFVTMKYHGDRYFYEEHLIEAEAKNIPEMLDFLKAFCQKHQLDSSFSTNLLVVGDELFSNIVKYGYGEEDGEIFLRLLYNQDKQEFVLTIVDKAPEFNPLTYEREAIQGEANGQPIGGLGILIVKTIMSETAYDRVNDKNILVLRKRF